LRRSADSGSSPFLDFAGLTLALKALDGTLVRFAASIRVWFLVALLLQRRGAVSISSVMATTEAIRRSGGGKPSLGRDGVFPLRRPTWLGLSAWQGQPGGLILHCSTGVLRSFRFARFLTSVLHGRRKSLFDAHDFVALFHDHALNGRSGASPSRKRRSFLCCDTLCQAVVLHRERRWWWSGGS